MHDRAYRFALKAAVLTVLCFSPLASVIAQELKTIQPQGGGMITYGQVAGQSTEAGAMGYILHNLHQQLGELPQVGKLFDVRGTQSVAAFFSISRHDQGSGKNPLHIGGLIIATKVSTDHVEAAVVSDESSRFPKTLGPMMKTLFASWHPLQSGSSGGSGPIAPLHQVVTQDRSASINLPDGWRLAPQMSMMGTVVAGGPHSESAELGTTWLVGDTNNPGVQRTLQQLRAGQLQNTMYARLPYYPWNSDPAQTFTYLIGTTRKRAGLPAATYRFSPATPVQGSAASQRCAHLTGTANMNDGSGDREINSLFCEQQPDRAGGYLASAYTTMAPMAIAASERATLGAILVSYQVDMSIVQRQANQIAAPAIEQIHAIGRAAEARIEAAHQAEAIHNSSVYEHCDNMDKRSQEFENYQLGYSVIGTTDNQYHGTFWNEDADALVKSHPDKFEYINAPNYWKGVDY